MTMARTPDEVFDEAIRQSPGSDRAAYLDEACGNDGALRGRVEQLLRAYDDAGSFLEAPAERPEAISDQPTIVERPGSVIGPYKLLQQIGEGGFGVVFLAEQEKPVRRRVALKVIKPGMDTREVIARFEAERQALAMMNHPNIAKVLDAGTTHVARSLRERDGGNVARSLREREILSPSEMATPGRPYFVMELVQGVPITEYCDQCNLTTDERLELFVTVCQAVQHAHQKGVIHRDIKPSNILIAIQDGHPTPKIIDFGVAKAIGQRLTEHSLMTAYAQMVGTPLYMSPEQAELSPLGVDTRTDIYSLGVLLYELLTGTTPIAKDRLHSASYDELRRIIREEEPPRPSARISTLAADLATTVADHRRTDVRRLRQAVRGELDWIVMKCLEKDRNRRYETPNSLARDVERYLNDDPVQACPPSMSYRFRKFVRRNKTLLAAGGAIAAALLVGLGLATWQYFRATTESVRAVAVSGFLREMLASSDPDQVKGAGYTVRELLDDFSAGLGDQLGGEPEVEADIHGVIGRAYHSLGVFDRAEMHGKKALDLRHQVFGAADEPIADDLIDYAWSLDGLGRHEEAERYAREALSIYQKCNADPNETILALGYLQHFLIRQSRLAEAEKVGNEALVLAGNGKDSDFGVHGFVLNDLSGIKSTQGKYEEAEKLARRAVEIDRRRKGDHHPKIGWGLRNLAQALKGQQKFAEAEAALREALAIFRENYPQEHHSVQSSSRDLASVLQAKGDRAGIEAFAKEEAEQFTRSGGPDYHVRLAQLLLMNNPLDAQVEEARRLIHWVLDDYSRAGVDNRQMAIRGEGHPDTPSTVTDGYPDRLSALNGLVRTIGVCASAPGFEAEVEKSDQLLEWALPKRLADFPGSNDCQWQTAMIYRDWAIQLLPHSQYLSTAERALREAIRIHEDLLISDPTRPFVSLYVADRSVLLGYVLWLTGRSEDAEGAYRRAMELCDQREAEEIAADQTSTVASFITIDSVWLAYYLGCTDRKDKALEFIRKAALSAQHVTEPAQSVSALFSTALVQLRLGDETGYRQSCRTMVDVPVANSDDSTKVRAILAWCLGPNAIEDRGLPVNVAEELVAHNSFEQPNMAPFVLGAALYRNGKYKQAAKELQESVTLYPSHPLPGFRTISWQRLFLAMTQWQLGQRDAARRLLAETQRAIDKELQTPCTSFDIRVALEVLRREAEELIGPTTEDAVVEDRSRSR